MLFCGFMAELQDSVKAQRGQSKQQHLLPVLLHCNMQAATHRRLMTSDTSAHAVKTVAVHSV